MSEIHSEALNEILSRYISQEGNIISLLQDIQESFGYIPEDVVKWFSKRLGIPPSRFFSVATFYAQFHLKPRGKNIITVCSGTACYVKGAQRLLSTVRRELNLLGEEDTTPDRIFTVERVNCIGACSIAPVFLINKKVYGNATSDKLLREIKHLKKGD